MMSTDKLYVMPLQVAAAVVVGGIVWGGLVASLYGPFVWGAQPKIPTSKPKHRDLLK